MKLLVLETFSAKYFTSRGREGQNFMKIIIRLVIIHAGLTNVNVYFVLHV